MAAKNILHMIGGNRETSYAKNSSIQKMVILKAWPVLEGTLKDMYDDNFPKCFKIADLGCSSGPNTLFVVSKIIDTMHTLCQQNRTNEPEFQVSLNDLPENDFNTTFKSLPEFYEKLKKKKGDESGPCFVSGVPGSFYGRLFLSKSLHFVHSSNSVHWLSQVPDRLESNKGNIYIVNTSPHDVYEAYLKQFQIDFSNFLSLRSEEIIPRGRMVLTFLSRVLPDPTSNDYCYISEIIAKSLLEMVAEGLVKEADLYSFNLPIFTPYTDEVEAIINKEGSFNLDRLQVFEVFADGCNDIEDKSAMFVKNNSGNNVLGTIRAILEPLLASHFGDSIIDNLWARYLKNVAENPSKEKTKFFNMVISLSKK